MPRTLGHKFKPDRFQDTYDFWTRQQGVLYPGRAEARKKQNVKLFWGIFENGLKLFRIGYLLDEPFPSLIKKAREALPELIPAMELGYAFEPDKIQDALCLALTVRLPKMIDWLADLPRDAYTDPSVEVSGIAFLITEAIQAGAKGNRKAFDAAVKKLRPAMAPKKLLVSPRQETAIYAPIVDLLEAVSAGDPAQFEKAWKAKGDAWKKTYSRASEAGNFDGILDITALGIARIAEGFGMKIPATHPYAPLDILGAAK
ncbi:MAG TPA: Imm49 family immunity protein [Planctomycetota bacterium]|nr:Imm49 family immunity protein [Planctomycetota bacterium]